jgi:hypothetical protein
MCVMPKLSVDSIQIYKIQVTGGVNFEKLHSTIVLTTAMYFWAIH